MTGREGAREDDTKKVGGLFSKCSQSCWAETTKGLVIANFRIPVMDCSLRRWEGGRLKVEDGGRRH